MSSEERRTASVFSSGSGRVALVRACIQEGASPALEAGTKAARQLKRAASCEARRQVWNMEKLCAGLHNDLLFVTTFHSLVEIAKRAVILKVKTEEVELQMAGNMLGALLVFHLEGVDDDFGVLVLLGR